MSAFDTGPYVAGAFFCEKVLTEGDGVHTYVRVVDRFAVHAVDTSAEGNADIDGALQQVTNPLVFVVGLRAGETRGTFHVRIVEELPSGQDEGAGLEVDVPFAGVASAGVYLHIPVTISAKETGVHWFKVFGGDDHRLLTRVPLEVVVTRLRNR